ncbi:hypothetical protein CHS0354_038167, partial [Potamilus streckersoni]
MELSDVTENAVKISNYYYNNNRRTTTNSSNTIIGRFITEASADCKRLSNRLVIHEAEFDFLFKDTISGGTFISNTSMKFTDKINGAYNFLLNYKSPQFAHLRA